MKNHITYKVECRDDDRHGYEIMTAKPLGLDDKDIIRKVRCGKCSSSVNVIEMDALGEPKALRGRARSAAASMNGRW